MGVRLRARKFSLSNIHEGRIIIDSIVNEWDWKLQSRPKNASCDRI